jgi:hypothetical protein
MATKKSEVILYCYEMYFGVKTLQSTRTSEINVGHCDRCPGHKTNEAAALFRVTRDVFLALSHGGFLGTVGPDRTHNVVCSCLCVYVVSAAWLGRLQKFRIYFAAPESSAGYIFRVPTEIGL